MTRINIVPVEELSDQWLIAEYRELPRCIKGNISIKDAPDHYVFGKGHMKWARKYNVFTCNRMKKIVEEMHFRGFKTNFSADLSQYITNIEKLDYTPNLADLCLSKQRLIYKYRKKPSFYRWTKREKPDYLKNI